MWSDEILRRSERPGIARWITGETREKTREKTSEKRKKKERGREKK